MSRMDFYDSDCHDDGWPPSLSVPLLDRMMTSYSASDLDYAGSCKTSSVVSSFSAETGHGVDGSVDVEAAAAARYFNNLRIATSDDDDDDSGMSSSLPTSIFRTRQQISPERPSLFLPSNSIGSGSSSSRLPIPFRPSNGSFDPYGDGQQLWIDDSGSRSLFPFSLLSDGFEGGGAMSFPCSPPESENNSSSLPANSTGTAYFDDPPLDLPLHCVRQATSSTAISIIENPSTPCTTTNMRTSPARAPRHLSQYDEHYPHSSQYTSKRRSTQGVLAVQGAGLVGVDGVYHLTGRSDSAGVYTKRSIHKGNQVTFAISRCITGDFSRKWFLSIIPSKRGDDFDRLWKGQPSGLYVAPSIWGGKINEFPPEDGWTVVPGSRLVEEKTPHCLWISMNINKRAGASSSLSNNISSNTTQSMEPSAPPLMPALDNSDCSPCVTKETTETIRKVAQCCVCLDANVDHCFVPCGHCAVCGDCAKQWKVKLPGGRRRQCPIGRCRVQGVIKLYGTIVEDAI